MPSPARSTHPGGRRTRKSPDRGLVPTPGASVRRRVADEDLPRDRDDRDAAGAAADDRRRAHSWQSRAGRTRPIRSTTRWPRSSVPVRPTTRQGRARRAGRSARSTRLPAATRRPQDPRPPARPRVPALGIGTDRHVLQGAPAALSGRTEGRGPQSLYGSCTSRPAIATPSGRSVCFTRTVPACAARTSGRRLYTSGASSAPPPTRTIPLPRSRS